MGSLTLAIYSDKKKNKRRRYENIDQMFRGPEGGSTHVTLKAILHRVLN